MTTNCILSQLFFEPYYISCVMCIQPFIFYTLGGTKTRKRGKFETRFIVIGSERILNSAAVVDIIYSDASCSPLIE